MVEVRRVPHGRDAGILPGSHTGIMPAFLLDAHRAETPAARDGGRCICQFRYNSEAIRRKHSRYFNTKTPRKSRANKNFIEKARGTAWFSCCGL
jgi:hypothetical protein